jgi:transcriptional regulator with GAF, ATPase, and Fis domain
MQPLDKSDSTTVQRELSRLRRQVAALEEENVRLNQEISEMQDTLGKQMAALHERLQKAESENREFASACVQVQQQNEVINNLYVASHRLHATLDPDEVMKIIQEILIELVGAEEFGILLLDPKKGRLQLVAGEGAAQRLPAASLPAGEGILGEVAASGEPFFFQPDNGDERGLPLPQAAIPLNFNGSAVGVIAIFKLLNQKAGFSAIDYQLLQLVAAHAATALVSARLHRSLDRKLKTMEGFMQLMKSS